MINPSLKETISYEKFRAYAAMQNGIKKGNKMKKFKMSLTS